jgi:hypothetical protein
MRLVARVTGWAAAGGLLATGLFAGIAAASNPGHAKVVTPATTSGSSGGTATTTPQQDQTTTTLDDGFGTQDPQPFQPPQNAPGNDVRGGGNVVSGGS